MNKWNRFKRILTKRMEDLQAFNKWLMKQNADFKTVILPNKPIRNFLKLILFLAVIAGFFHWHVALAYYIFPKAEAPIGSTLTMFFTIVGGFLIYLTYQATLRRAIATEKTAQAQAETAKAQLESSKAHREENQIQRFNQAIEQLGHNEASVRMGGIYTLHGIAKESDDKKLRENICNIFCAYIRDRSQSLVQTIRNTETEEMDEVINQVSADIQAVCEVLFREDSHEIYADYKKVLSDSKLKKIRLPGCYFLNTELRSANLENAELRSARLEKADLRGAIIADSDLREAHLEGAILTNAHLEMAKLSDAHLEGAKLSNSHLEGARLHETHCEGARLYKAHLEGADLTEAYFEDALLSFAHLDEAVLHHTHFERAKLYYAHLEEADFKNAFLEGAEFEHAYLNNAENLTVQQLLSTKTLFNSLGFTEEMLGEIRNQKPELLEDPSS